MNPFTYSPIRVVRISIFATIQCAWHATTMLDQRLCAICSPSVQPAAPRHASRGRSGVLEPVASGAGAHLPARPSGAHTSIAIYRCEVADCGTRPTDSDQKQKQE
jgi:hypothetical protein